MYTKKQIPTPFLQQPSLSEDQTIPPIETKMQPNQTSTAQQKNTSCTNPAVLALAFLLFQNER